MIRKFIAPLLAGLALACVVAAPAMAHHPSYSKAYPIAYSDAHNVCVKSAASAGAKCSGNAFITSHDVGSHSTIFKWSLRFFTSAGKTATCYYNNTIDHNYKITARETVLCF